MERRERKEVTQTLLSEQEMDKKITRKSERGREEEEEGRRGGDMGWRGEKERCCWSGLSSGRKKEKRQRQAKKREGEGFT